ncbi:hypothetical protein BDB00DRAFT_532491 [Zychaea mexicana]|uniref:uncharacterized protein n=1 Tax=Zychaea mexicana TaxID=64656 RepID=UPI0022FE0C34|nr:uncharacterized protein BDB00DRAFT_532491 [Zychaea mexicana]KAI9490709.1 hypothetical protein BDB00DRAFT_532491 [Zychaea mexicana]
MIRIPIVLSALAGLALLFSLADGLQLAPIPPLYYLDSLFRRCHLLKLKEASNQINIRITGESLIDDIQQPCLGVGSIGYDSNPWFRKGTHT